jgi:putative transposase-like DNA-binding protein
VINRGRSAAIRFRQCDTLGEGGLGEIRRQLSYKTTRNGGKLIIADRWYPSSKTCSGCGVAKANLPLRVRTFTREHRGLHLDRDLNAARNLAQLVTSTTGTAVAADPTPNRVNGREADKKSTLVVAGGCEASTPTGSPGKTGAARWKRRAARRSLFMLTHSQRLSLASAHPSTTPSGHTQPG